ncbi:RNA methyltransferase [Aurantibacter crassamenti]|uniref:TrmH family RNA methyltransferase n=1 Tax=Aurantibacter crassamenti TaxID=1837375 RepID=UPI001939D0FC|nr:RNA methyltransferase [Aurantibacter crassamenti]MBM1108086.1 RNA methyltransferase [Aurantibacter crassamenti]
MVVKSQIKLIKSLLQKKYRNQHSLFVVEGVKTVKELLKSDIQCYQVYSTDPSLFSADESTVQQITEKELNQMSNLKTPNKVLGIFRIPETKTIDFSNWVIALDGVSDPGNLGTIIRLCDWFGIRNLLCSPNTVDCYNPKVLQATMGSISRINIVYDNLPKILKDAKVLICGTFMDGESCYQQKFNNTGILVMGNEANGVSKEIEALCSQRISIPHFGNSTTESLNVATAAAIFLSEIRRG